MKYGSSWIIFKRNSSLNWNRSSNLTKQILNSLFQENKCIQQFKRRNLTLKQHPNQKNQWSLVKYPNSCQILSIVPKRNKMKVNKSFPKIRYNQQRIATINHLIILFSINQFWLVKKAKSRIARAISAQYKISITNLTNCLINSIHQNRLVRAQWTWKRLLRMQLRLLPLWLALWHKVYPMLVRLGRMVPQEEKPPMEAKPSPIQLILEIKLLRSDKFKGWAAKNKTLKNAKKVIRLKDLLWWL